MDRHMGFHRLPLATLIFFSSPLFASKEGEKKSSRQIEINKESITIKDGEASAELKAGGSISLQNQGRSVELKPDGVSIQSDEATAELKTGSISVQNQGAAAELKSDAISITSLEGNVEVSPDAISIKTDTAQVHLQNETLEIQSSDAKVRTENNALSIDTVRYRVSLSSENVVIEEKESGLPANRQVASEPFSGTIAQPSSRSAPKLLPLAKAECSLPADSETPLPVQLATIYISRGQTGLPPDERGIVFEPDLFTCAQQAELCRDLSPYLNTKLFARDIEKIRKAAADALIPGCQPLTTVMIPPQDITNGTLRIVLFQSTIGEVSVCGNKYFPAQEILKRSGLSQGCGLYLRQLEKNLAGYNRNPFVRVDAVLKPGIAPGTTDVDLVVMDRLPFRPYVGGDNTGVQFTDKPRFYTGFTAGRLFGTNQQFSYQFTTTSQPAEFAAHSANYTIPLPWAAQNFMLYGGWARVRGDLPSTALRNKGTAWQVSGRYQIPISPFYGTVIEEIYFGYDFKRTNNSFLFGGDTVSTQGADINQIVLGCTLDFRSRKWKTSLVAEVFGAPWRLTAAQSAARYSQLRYDAKPLYAYGRLRISHTRDLMLGFQLKGLLAGQGTGWNLLPSETFGLGGYATVRGYEERALNTDSGINASIEFLTPKLPLISLSKKKYDKEELRFLAFADYGMGVYSTPAPGQKKMQWLLGAGGGVRYNYSTNIVLRCDVGAPFHKAGEGRHGMHVHTGGTLSY